MENEVLDLKLKVKGNCLFDIFTKMQINRFGENDSERKETIKWNFIELIIKSDEIFVEAARSSLLKWQRLSE